MLSMYSIWSFLFGLISFLPWSISKYYVILDTYLKLIIDFSILNDYHYHSKYTGYHSCPQGFNLTFEIGLFDSHLYRHYSIQFDYFSILVITTSYCFCFNLLIVSLNFCLCFHLFCFIPLGYFTFKFFISSQWLRFYLF